MDSRKYVFLETLRVAVGEAVCVAAMIGIFALLGQFSREVVIGGIVGGLVAILLAWRKVQVIICVLAAIGADILLYMLIG